MFVNRRLAWALLATCALSAFTAFAYPMYVIRPFRAQGPGELAAALVLRRWGPPAATAAAILALFLSVLLWRTTRRAAMRTVSTFAVFLTIAFAVLSRVNVYEMMFHRVDSPQAMHAG
jgi:hypothetical protein